ncbi:unnamed protein product [Larinioides sclopetarius]|uniref:Uncharacterized protein n=1 Tax=Larinioides sclopetarius TaxID=280406 RepID=A0AAV2B9S3_9ARAC
MSLCLNPWEPQNTLTVTRFQKLGKRHLKRQVLFIFPPLSKVAFHCRPDVLFKIFLCACLHNKTAFCGLRRFESRFIKFKCTISVRSERIMEALGASHRIFLSNT